MDLITRLTSDSVWFVSTTAASLDVTVILVCVVSLSICAGLAAFLFSFFKEESFEDGLKASREKVEDKETRRKQQEEKDAAKQRANELKKARKNAKKASGLSSSGQEKDTGIVTSGTVKEQVEYEFDEDSSATATPEPGFQKQGKPTSNLQHSKIAQDDSAILLVGHDEKGMVKKAGKINIEEVDFVAPAEPKVCEMSHNCNSYCNL